MTLKEIVFPAFFITILIAATALILSCTDQRPAVSGVYRATLDSPGGEIAFPLHVRTPGGDSLEAFVVNGADTSRFSSVALSADSVRFSFDFYDSHIRARVTPEGDLTGRWDRRSAGGRIRMDFTARKGVRNRYPPTDPDTSRFDGNWQVTFRNGNGTTSPGYAMFVTEPSGRIHGTIRTETGDYRFLDGVYDNRTMTLSTFDGSHAWLAKARWSPDSTLNGEFWYYNTSRKSWTAHRGEENLRDPLQISAEQAVGKKISFAFPNTEGDTITARDARFQNKPMLVYLFGTWCPNCSDEARMVRELYEDRYKRTDLEIAGLAYEYTGDFRQDAEMVRRYRRRFDIPWTLLIAGTSDKESAAGTLPFLNEVISFPTSIFVDRSHTITGIHVGFNGPATGSAYFKEKQSFIKYLDEITES